MATSRHNQAVSPFPSSAPFRQAPAAPEQTEPILGGPSKGPETRPLVLGGWPPQGWSKPQDTGASVPVTQNRPIVPSL